MSRFERAAALLGLAAFAVSLAHFAWLFRHVGGSRPAAADWPARAAFDLALFTAFALHHSLTARDGFKRWLATHVGTRNTRVVYVWISSALLIAVTAMWRRVGGDLYLHAGWSSLPHQLIALAGVVIGGWASSSINLPEFVGLRDERTDGPLRVGGLYRLVRHPIYLGIVLLVASPAHMTGDRLLLAGLTTLYLAAAVPFEERTLERHFGAAYRAYQQSVRWRIVPFVY